MEQPTMTDYIRVIYKVFEAFEPTATGQAVALKHVRYPDKQLVVIFMVML